MTAASSSSNPSSRAHLIPNIWKTAVRRPIPQNSNKPATPSITSLSDSSVSAATSQAAMPSTSSVADGKTAASQAGAVVQGGKIHGSHLTLQASKLGSSSSNSSRSSSASSDSDSDGEVGPKGVNVLARWMQTANLKKPLFKRAPVTTAIPSTSSRPTIASANTLSAAGPSGVQSDEQADLASPGITPPQPGGKSATAQPASPVTPPLLPHASFKSSSFAGAQTEAAPIPSKAALAGIRILRRAVAATSDALPGAGSQIQNTGTHQKLTGRGSVGSSSRPQSTKLHSAGLSSQATFSPAPSQPASNCQLSTSGSLNAAANVGRVVPAADGIAVAATGHMSPPITLLLRSSNHQQSSSSTSLAQKIPPPSLPSTPLPFVPSQALPTSSSSPSHQPATNLNTPLLGNLATSAGHIPSHTAETQIGCVSTSSTPHVDPNTAPAALPTTSLPAFPCLLCNVSCNSPQTLQQHLSSKRHLSRSAAATASAATINTTSSVTITSPVHPDSSTSQPSPSSPDVSASHPASLPGIAAGAVKAVHPSCSQAEQPPGISSLNPDPWFCSACNVRCNGAAPFNQHQLSSKHLSLATSTAVAAATATSHLTHKLPLPGSTPSRVLGVPPSPVMRVHSLCRQTAITELDELVVDVLTKVKGFQERAMLKNAIKVGQKLFLHACLSRMHLGIPDASHGRHLNVQNCDSVGRVECYPIRYE